MLPTRLSVANVAGISLSRSYCDDRLQRQFGSSNPHVGNHERRDKDVNQRKLKKTYQPSVMSWS